MDIIVDIQGFKDVEETFFPKEVAIVSINNAYYAYWIIAQPCSFTELWLVQNPKIIGSVKISMV